MSLADITLNSKVFSVSSVQGSKVVRRCTAATLPAGLQAMELEISHAPGTGTKTDRHLFKLTKYKLDAETGKLLGYSIHAVLTVPKGEDNATQVAYFSGTGAMGDDLSDFLALDTFASSGRLLNGEFS